MTNKKALILVVAAIVFGAGGMYSWWSVQTPVITGVDGLLAKLDKNQLLGLSDIVVEGAVTKMETVRAPSDVVAGKDAIYTIVTLDIQKYLYNPREVTAPQIRVRTLGGVLDGVETRVVEGHEYAAGQRVIMFLKRDSDSMFVDVAPQGVYTINTDGSLGANEREQAFVRDAFGANIDVDALQEEVKTAKPEEIHKAPSQ